MVTSVLDRPLVPIAGPDDAIATYEELRPYPLETEIVSLVVHVIEKAGGAPDKISVQQREEYVEEAFDAFRKRARTDGIEVDAEILYGGERRWLDLVTGRVRANLIADSDLPVLVLPQREAQP